MENRLSIEELTRGFVQHTLNNPREVGYFSMDSEKKLHFDRSLMMYCVPMEDVNPPLDLNLGYENALRDPINFVNNMDNLSQWIAYHSHFQDLESVDFVTTRGTIQKLLCTPYCQGEYNHWMICVRRIGDTMYLRTILTDDKIEKELNATEESKRMCAWGFKFENYMTAGEMQDRLCIKETSRGSVQYAFNIPREVGYYSVDSEKALHFDRSLMMYCVPLEDVNLPLDLNLGYEKAVRHPYNPIHKLDKISKWIAYHSRFEDLDGVDFVTTRGTIQKLLCTPYCQGEYNHWMICVRRIGDTMYLRTILTDDKIEKELNATEESKRMCSWGFKFENYMTADSPDGIPDLSSITHEVEKYVTVFSNKIGPFNLLMCAEVDGVEPSKSYRLFKADTSCYVEIKTSKFTPNFRSSYNFKRYKTLQWWAQSVIVGIEDNICGMRDDNGIVQSIEKFRTEELVSLGQNFWRPRVCFNFCNNFLKYLRRTVKDNPRIVYKFEYTGGPSITVSTLRDPEERFQVIPEWFLDELQKHERRKKF